MKRKKMRTPSRFEIKRAIPETLLAVLLFGKESELTELVAQARRLDKTGRIEILENILMNLKSLPDDCLAKVARDVKKMATKEFQKVLAKSHGSLSKETERAFEGALRSARRT